MLVKKDSSWLGRIIWLLILGGMLALALGLTVQRSDAALGTTIAGGAGIAIVIGIVLIWVRSRRPDDPSP